MSSAAARLSSTLPSHSCSRAPARPAALAGCTPRTQRSHPARRSSSDCMALRAAAGVAAVAAAADQQPPVAQQEQQVVQLQAVDITAENFAPFGQVRGVLLPPLLPSPALLLLLEHFFFPIPLQLVGPTDDGKQYDGDDAQLDLSAGTPRWVLARRQEVRRPHWPRHPPASRLPATICRAATSSCSTATSMHPANSLQ